MKNKTLTLLILIISIAIFAEVPHKMLFQGRFVDEMGDAYIGEYDLVFKLYYSEVGGTSLWEESRTVTFHAGLLNIYLGEFNPLPYDIFTGDVLWLEVIIDGEPLERKPTASVAYSFRAVCADSVDINLDTLGAYLDTTFAGFNWADSAHWAAAVHWDSIISAPEAIVTDVNDLTGSIDILAGTGISLESIGGHITISSDIMTGDSDWEIDGDNMTAIPSGNIGIGVITPEDDNRLHVRSSGDTGERAVYGEYSATGPQGWLGTENYGAYGQYNSENYGALGSSGIGINARGASYAAYLDGNTKITGDIELNPGAKLYLDGDDGAEKLLASNASGELYWEEYAEDADPDPTNEYISNFVWSDAMDMLQIQDGGGTWNVTIDDEDDDLSDNSIDDLSDVNTAGTASGQVLKWSGTEWLPADDLNSGGTDDQTLAEVLTSGNTANMDIDMNSFTLTNLPDATVLGEPIVYGQAAGGDLDGTYPNPTIANGAVADDEIDYASVTLADFTNDIGFVTAASLSDNNNATVPVDWDDLADIPAGFADGTDDDDLTDNYLGDLSNVDEAGVVDGSVLVYNGSSGNWEIGSGGFEDADSDPTNECITSFAWDDPSNDLAILDDCGLHTVTIDNEADDLSDNVIEDLTNVDVTGAINGSVLKYNAGNWEIGIDEGGTGVETDPVYSAENTEADLEDHLIDVSNVFTDNEIDQTGAVMGSILKFNSVSEEWQVGTDEIDDADSDPTNEFNTGLIWTDATDQLQISDAGGLHTVTINNEADDLSDNVIEDLTNVDVTGAINGSVLKYNAGNWEIGIDEGGSETTDLDWQISTDIGDGTADTTLVMGGKWGLFREGNVGFGDQCSTHVNLGVACTTGNYGGSAECLTIGGGYGNRIIANYSTISGGFRNEVLRENSVVSGGSGNSINGIGSSIGGGYNNTVNGYMATICGGEDNQVDSLWSIIGGGQGNLVEQRYSVITGGRGNTCLADHCFIGSGGLNFISEDGKYSAIVTGFENSLASEYSFVGGGYFNDCYNDFSVVAGGKSNQTYGSYSVIPGGQLNFTWGSHSLAFGHQAVANLDSMAIFDWYGSDRGALFVEKRPLADEDSLRENYSIIAGHGAKVYGDLVVTGEIDPVAVTYQPQTTAPPVARGKLYYDDSDNELKVHDGAEWKSLAAEGGGDFIQNQRDSLQTADLRIKGQAEAGRVIITPDAEDTSFTPRTGMLKSIGENESFRMLVYDGSCWREMSLSDCVSGSFYCSILGLTSDTLYLCAPYPLTVSIAGGVAPYDLDWNDDGLGDWDDPNEIDFSTDSYPDTIICMVRDADMNIVADTIIINHGIDTMTCVEEVIDYDGNTYEVVRIGCQCWMAENLKVTHYRDGTPIDPVTDNTEWEGLDATETGAYCAYNDNPSNVATYGRLYNWYAVDDVHELAPDGWHVATDEEWKILEMYLGMSETEADFAEDWRGTNEGSKLAGRADLWDDGVLEADPEFGTSGFSALPGGFRAPSGGYHSIASQATFWSSSEFSSANAWRRCFVFSNKEVFRGSLGKRYGRSVRCVRD